MKKLKTKIFIFNLRSNSIHLDTLSHSYSDSEDVELVAIRDYKEINTALRGLGSSKAILIFKVDTKLEFTQVLAILKARYKQINLGDIKPVCITGFKNRRAEGYLNKFGCSIQIDSKVSQKAFSLKIDLAVKSVIPKQNYSEFNGISQKDEIIDLSINSHDGLDTEFNELANVVDKEVESIPFQLGDSLANNIEFKKSKFSFKLLEEDNPELVSYIKESGDMGKVNLQDGRIDISLSNEVAEGIQCLIDNFEKESITLEMGGIVNLSEGDDISISVKFIYNKCKVEIELDGNISDCELSDSINGSSFVTIKLSQSEDEKLNYFMSLYEQRQKSINDFMELAKGY
jgi:hypothetical protein